MPETCRVIYNNKQIVASSGYLSSFSYMMNGHTYIVLGTIEKSVIVTCRNNPEEFNLHQHSCDNLIFLVLQVQRGR